MLTDDLTFSFATLDNGELVSKFDGQITFPSSQSLELDEIRVISDVDQANYAKDFDLASGVRYVAV